MPKKLVIAEDCAGLGPVIPCLKLLDSNHSMTVVVNLILVARTSLLCTCYSDLVEDGGVEGGGLLHV